MVFSIRNLIAPRRKAKLPFDDAPGFYLDDNRRFRRSNPITKETLTAKMSVQLPEGLVRNKTVLDLGSCLGAAGQWALFYGASRYVGVETQEDYVVKSRELLASHGNRAEIVHGDIRSFLAAAPSQQFDVTVAMGVIYLFFDPHALVKELCRVSKEAVVIESVFPALAGKGAHPGSMYTEYRFDQDVNMADGNYSLSGIAAAPSPAALDVFFRLCGFVNRDGLLSFPERADLAIYSQAARQRPGVASRFAVRYFGMPDQMPLKTLEENLPTRSGRRRAWDDDPAYARGTAVLNSVARLLSTSDAPQGADGRTTPPSLPNDERRIEKTVEILRKSAFSDPKIIAVGGAVGATLDRLHEAGFRRLFGSGRADDMPARISGEAAWIRCEAFPDEREAFDAIVANRAPPVIRPRERYLQALAEALRSGGILILTEKILSGDLTQSLYDDYVRPNEGTDESSPLYPPEWHIKTLTELGFRSIDVVDADYAVATWIARR
jgi:SAM-dependent methyltransferase